ncbi:conserved hypothetical protein [Histoplasma capsulatum H143]|uniref:C2H2-type domain-containing protein n=1 Tax=Ajellomyces capsulatus (strain H143) TaxID=544712 RepID=C6H576_AJECH|nr:conserved hypothetical protein [Histoplasma capsulatum H143]
MAIYHQASKCSDLFDELVAHENGHVGLCSVIQERFERWAFHHDIFAPIVLSLDEKLRHHAASFQNFVEAHLMFLSDCIARLLNRINRTSDGGTHPQTEVNEQEQKSLRDLISEEADEVKCVVKGVDDLYRLNYLITSRLAQCKIIDMLGFAHHPDFLTFQELCWGSVVILYPYIHRELRDRLGASMTRRYAATFRQKFAQPTVEKLQTHPNTMTAEDGEPEESNEDRVPNKTEKARGIQDWTTISSRSDFTRGGSKQGQGILNDSPKLGSKFQQTWSDQFHQENYPEPPKRNADTITCEWCSADLAEEILKPGYWRQHVNADLMPYPCIAEECTESHAQFAEFADWFNHMQSHEENWHKKIYTVTSWTCPDCFRDGGKFISSQHLLVHLLKYHTDVYPVEILKTISRCSSEELPRAQDECLLCGYKLEQTAPPKHLYSGKRRKRPPREMKSKSARTNLAMSNPKPHSLSDERPEDDDDISLGSNSSKIMALHISGHLQMLMLLTVRLALIQNNQETSIQGTNSGSINADIDDNSSCGLSTNDSLEATEEELSESASTSDGEFDPVLETPVPDNDLLSDWSHIPRRDVAPEEDEFLQQVIKSGAYQSHLNLIYTLTVI